MELGVYESWVASALGAILLALAIDRLRSLGHSKTKTRLAVLEKENELSANDDEKTEKWFQFTRKQTNLVIKSVMPKLDLIANKQKSTDNKLCYLDTKVQKLDNRLMRIENKSNFSVKSHNHQILLLEDDNDNADFMKRFLSMKCDSEVTRVDSPYKGIEKLEIFKYHLVIGDVNLKDDTIKPFIEYMEKYNIYGINSDNSCLVLYTGKNLKFRPNGYKLFIKPFDHAEFKNHVMSILAKS